MIEVHTVFSALNDRCKYIFKIIQKNGPLTKSELIDISKIKLTTLNRELEKLLDKRLVIEADIGESTGGRKPSLYDINPSEFYIFGIDISRTYARIVLTNLKLEIIEEEVIDYGYKIEAVNEIIPTYIKQACAKLKIEKSSIVGVGIGIVGGFYTDIIHETLSKELEAPIYIDNGANAAVIGEYNFGIGKDKKNIAYVNCGVGIRTGIISSGVLIRTVNNLEDAFGHMIIDANGELCSCGNYGCIESYVSITKIVQKFIDQVKENSELFIDKDLEQIDYKDVCILAERKNQVAMEIVKQAAFYLGIGLSNYIKLSNPELIILSGPLIQHSKLFFDIARETALKKCHIKNDNIQFADGGFYKDKSIAVGACAMVIKNIEESEVNL